MKLPPWSGGDEAMYLWCEHMIDHQNQVAVNTATEIDRQRALEYARKTGEVGPLRLCHPDLAAFLHAPKRGRGRHPRQTATKEATLALIGRVYALWGEHYKKKRRRRDDGIDAVEIAARFMGLDQNTVSRWTRK